VNNCALCNLTRADGSKYTLSVERGIQIQTEDLERWGRILKPEVLEEMTRIATASNAEARCGHDIERGDGLREIADRISLEKKQ